MNTASKSISVENNEAENVLLMALENEKKIVLLWKNLLAECYSGWHLKQWRKWDNLAIIRRDPQHTVWEEIWFFKWIKAEKEWHHLCVPWTDKKTAQENNVICVSECVNQLYVSEICQWTSNHAALFSTLIDTYMCFIWMNPDPIVFTLSTFYLSFTFSSFFFQQLIEKLIYDRSKSIYILLYEIRNCPNDRSNRVRKKRQNPLKLSILTAMHLGLCSMPLNILSHCSNVSLCEFILRYWVTICMPSFNTLSFFQFHLIW